MVGDFHVRAQPLKAFTDFLYLHQFCSEYLHRIDFIIKILGGPLGNSFNIRFFTMLRITIFFCKHQYSITYRGSVQVWIAFWTSSILLSFRRFLFIFEIKSSAFHFISSRVTGSSRTRLHNILLIYISLFNAAITVSSKGPYMLESFLINHQHIAIVI